jgi:hypothetical protein
MTWAIVLGGLSVALVLIAHIPVRRGFPACGAVVSGLGLCLGLASLWLAVIDVILVAKL